ncbi:SRP14 (YDL092W) [Zygosaccharomyces parabailii]|uniref:Signal recognition particle subunit SRP14 n=1 Tax=Zygosaccharomyces bailii (strain CLIB 213 / ATCC 58445 / CBS 680 / BCRC 21525 / NBRC 1098 / NCYC 1416 / NRRL Y-2227) TaxID=1333698 RepID=A0A8J2T7A0_ZYGB2|nr:SRP14 (YDL092W) [Zygosaccharomyces parabailii]CDF88491.1 BN860_11496g1_1 [Zygosaccharomyces bailii CLIB 213]
MVNEGRLANEDFLTKVKQFFHIANEKHITVRLTTKRLVVHDPIEGNAEFDATLRPRFDVSQQSQSLQVKNNSSNEYSLLIKMSYGSGGKKTKCSTVVSSNELDKFWQDYSNAVKSGMNGLIKKKKKDKAKGKTHKK